MQFLRGRAGNLSESGRRNQRVGVERNKRGAAVGGEGSKRGRLNRMGFVLLSTTALIMFLTFNCLVLAELMVIDDVVSHNAAEFECAKMLSNSGAAYVRVCEAVGCGLLSDEEGYGPGGEGLEASIGQRVPLSLASGRTFGGFEVSHWDAVRNRWTGGVFDEASKLNVNQLPLQPEYALEARRMLQSIPGVSPALADAILDWLDTDEEPRAYGAESAYYQSVDTGGSSRNGAIVDLAELLPVRGMTDALLFGERDGPATLSEALGGRMTRGSGGLSAYLTVYGGPVLYREDGRSKVLVNGGDLPALYDGLASALGERVATFVVAYRMYGPRDKTLLIADRVIRDRDRDARSRAARQLGLADATSGVTQRSEESVRRGTLTIRGTGRYRIRSLYDLVGIEVALPGRPEPGRPDSQILKSPWSTDPNELAASLPELRRSVSCVGGTDFAVLVNCNTAGEPVLNAVPGMPRELARRIVQSRDALSVERGDSLEWLLVNEVLSLTQMRRFAPYFTARGSAVRFVSVGIAADSSVVAAQSFVIDHSCRPVFVRRIPAAALEPR